MITAPVRSHLETALGENVRFDVPMSRHTSLRVGGPADAFATPADRAQLQALLALCAEHELPVTVVGAGFNTLVSDAGIEGVVVCLKRFRRIEREGDDALRAEAGVSHSQVTRFCTNYGLAGLEFGAGIPGTVGGWIAMNAGIPSRELVDAVQRVEVVGPGAEPARELEPDALDFAYRAARGLPRGALVVSTRLAVTASTPDAVETVVKRFLAARADTQPLDVPSCGSVFKNPEGDFAGRLIEAAGLKGARAGGAQISPLHANFIANTGGASAADVRELIERARNEVERRSGVRLCPEVRMVGRFE